MITKKWLFIMVLFAFWACKAKQDATATIKQTETFDLAKMEYNKAKLSPFGHKLLLQIQKEWDNNDSSFAPSESTIKEFGLKEIEGLYYVNSIIQVDKELPNEELEKLGIKPRTKEGLSMRTTSIPIKQLAALTLLKAVKYIEIDTKVSTK